jgi:hypothetical protein
VIFPKIAVTWIHQPETVSSERCCVGKIPNAHHLLTTKVEQVPNVAGDLKKFEVHL